MSGRAFMEVEQSTQAWTPTDPAARRWADDPRVSETLVIALAGFLGQEL